MEDWISDILFGGALGVFTVIGCLLFLGNMA